MYDAKVLADSIADDVRLTTLQVTFPRIVLAEFNTHRTLSRNSASSRAIPVEKRIAAIRADPFVPEAFGANQRGMQAGEQLDETASREARICWLTSMAQATDGAMQLATLGVHKQWANRLIEPFAWHTVIVTATEWANFFALRCSPEAQPEIRRVAELMRDAMTASVPQKRKPGEWHLPLTDASMGDWRWAEIQASREGHHDAGLALAKLSSARCARVSYLTHDGKRDPEADLELHDRLLKSGHMSPFEHAARVAGPLRPNGCVAVPDERGRLRLLGPFVGNFRAPWQQYRKQIAGEAVFGSQT